MLTLLVREIPSAFVKRHFCCLEVSPPMILPREINFNSGLQEFLAQDKAALIWQM